MKRKLKVTITKIQRIRLTNETPKSRVFCPICEDFVEIVQIDETKEQFENLMKEKVHRIPMEDGNLRYCKNSLWQNEILLPNRH